jgi:hypothetical protein
MCRYKKIKIISTGEIIPVENNSQIQVNITYELWKRKLKKNDYEFQ